MTQWETITVARDEAGARLDAVLAGRLRDLSRSSLAAIVRDGKVTLNGRPAKPSQRVRDGDRIDVELEPMPARLVAAEPIPLQILFRDEDIAVVDKPAGLVVHPAPGHWTGTLANAIIAAFPAVQSAGVSDRPGIVHRLDKDTSGLIAIALTPRGLKSLHRQIGSREAQRQYLALVRGEPSPADGIIEAPIGRDPADRKRMAPFGIAARDARTRYRTLERIGGFALIEATLETGRTHQIRVHLAAVGHPVAGDRVYGGPEIGGLQRQFLHAYRLRIHTPSTREIVDVESPLPADLRAALDRLRENSGTWREAGTPDVEPV